MPVVARGKNVVEKGSGKVVAHSSSAGKAKSAATMRNMAHAVKQGHISKEAFDKVKEKAGNTDFRVEGTAPQTEEVFGINLVPDHPTKLTEVAGTNISQVQNIPVTAYKGSVKGY
jgi:hypothetical protein